MDITEIRLRCLEAAQQATRSPTITPADAIVRCAQQFEAYVTGEEKTPTKAKAKSADKPAA